MSNSFVSFSPYQTPPDESRLTDGKSKSKAKTSSSASPPPKPNPFSFSSAAGSSRYPASASAGGLGPAALEEGHGFLGSSGGPPGQIRVNKYETQLGIRVDVEAALAYSLGAITGVLLLITETKNDYVRFHAWQSSITFLIFWILQIIFSFSTILSWLLLFVEIGAACWLAYNAYMDGTSLERYEIPIIGAMASQWVDSE